MNGHDDQSKGTVPEERILKAWFRKAIARSISDLLLGSSIAAIERERERAAKIAETWADGIPDADQEVFRQLAAKIREGK